MIFLFALPFPVLVALYLGWRAGPAGSARGSESFGRHAAAALAWGFAVVFLWHCLWITSAYSSPLGKKTALSGANLDPWDWGGLGADFDDFLCYNGVENSAHGVKTRGKFKARGF